MLKLITLLFTILACYIPLRGQTASHSGQPFFWVKNYGAIGDGKHLDHIAINNAIQDCEKAGGGTVIVTAGRYLCGSIHLRSDVNLQLDAGAVIVGAPSESNAYDPSEEFTGTAYQDGGHTYFHNSLIWGENLKNTSITGKGMIDGGGLTSKDHEHLGDPTGGSIGTGDKAIAIKTSSNILIRDITIYHGGHFAILLTGCDLVTLDNLIIDTNRDGIDLDCCTNSVVSNCRVNSPNDDAICPKSSFALNKPVITENLIITNCQVSGYKEGTLLSGERIPAKAGWSNGRIKFGTESNGGFRNCIVSNCTFRSCNGLALELVDGGIMENIIVSNLTMMDISHYPIYVTLGKRNRGPAATTRTGSVRNIYISNVNVTGAEALSGIQLTGVSGSNLNNIRLQNIFVEYKGGGTRAQGEKVFPELDKGYPEPSLLGANPAYGLFARHVDGLQLDNIQFVTVSADERPALICNDVSNLVISRFRAKPVPNVSLVKLSNVKKYSIEHSPGLEKN